MPHASLIRRRGVLPFVAVASFACTSHVATTPSPASPAVGTRAPVTCCLQQGLAIAAHHRVAAITERRFTQQQFWTAIEPSLRSPKVRVTEVGRSIQGRPIRAVTFGNGPTKVLLWSQMHGDESTATMALADIFAFLTDAAKDPLRDRIERALTVVVVPMLNPDGAELFQRENAAGIDINRDARRLSSPEARALKALRDSLQPAFGFNLHDQNARTLTGARGRQVAIALLAPASDVNERFEGARANARLVASGIAELLQREIPGRVGRYDEGFNVRAFGDNMQHWGTATVLIESGALPGDPQKQRLRAINVAAILSAFDAMATGSWRTADPAIYDALGVNDRSANDLLVRGGSIVLPNGRTLVADISLNYEESVAKLRPRLREVGDLSDVTALDTLDASGLFLHPEPGMLTTQNGATWMRIGTPVNLTIRRGAEASSEIVRRIP